MKHLASLLIVLILLVSCHKSEPFYSVDVSNNLKVKIGAVKIRWTDNYSVQLGDIYPNSGAGEDFVHAPKGKTILSYYVGDKEIKKEIDIIGIIPKNQSGSIIINIMENDVVEIKFKNNNE